MYPPGYDHHVQVAESFSYSVTRAGTSSFPQAPHESYRTSEIFTNMSGLCLIKSMLAGTARPFGTSKSERSTTHSRHKTGSEISTAKFVQTLTKMAASVRWVSGRERTGIWERISEAAAGIHSWRTGTREKFWPWTKMEEIHLHEERTRPSGNVCMCSS